MTDSSLWVLTGGRGAGKTVRCGALAEQASIAGWDVAGLLSPVLYDYGIDVLSNQELMRKFF